MATLSFLARYLKENPPQRTVMLVATSGHAQALAGLRELVWSLTTRSKIIRDMKRNVEALIKKTRNTITAFDNASFGTTAAENTTRQESQMLVKNALAGYHGFTFVTVDDSRPAWGTPYDLPENVDFEFALRQSVVVTGLIHHLTWVPNVQEGIFPRNGFSEINGNAKFLRHGELFADQPAPGTVLLCYQGPARYHVMVDHMGKFHLRGLVDKKHSYYKLIFEGYKFDETTGVVAWTIDKKQTGKDSYRVKMLRRHMETDLIMFACQGITLFDLMEPRTFHYLHRAIILDGRRETEPLHYFYSRLDTWVSF